MNGQDSDDGELTFICLTMATYRRLSMIARKKGKTVSQLIAGAIEREILEYEASTSDQQQVAADKPA